MNLHVAVAVTTMFLSGVVTGQVVVDGTLDSDMPAHATLQTVATGFNDSDYGQPGFCNGSELNAVHIDYRDGSVVIFLAGNLESNFNKLELFVDARAGGQNQLRHTAGVGERCVENSDTATGRRLKINLVGANAETTHSHQLLGGFKYFLGQLGAGTDADEVRIGNLLDQLFLGQRVRQVLNVGIARSIQRINGRLMHAFQQQDTDFALLKRRI